MVLPYKVLKGALWTKFDDIKGSQPLVWTPKSLTDEILFSVSLRGMSVFSSRPSNISYSKMFTTIPFPEYEFFSVSTIIYETSEEVRGEFSINLISILVPSFLMENAWIDLRQIQAVFQEYFAHYEGQPILNKSGVIEKVAKSIDIILDRKLKVIDEGEKIRDQLSKYLDSYLITSRSKAERELIQARIKTLIQSLDRVLEAGDHTRIQRAFERMNFILEQELEDEFVTIYRNTFNQFIST
jgi:hypothetical protein